MRKLSSAVLTSSLLLGSFVLAQGCGSAKKPGGFFDEAPAPNKSDAAAEAAAVEVTGPGPSFADDAGDGGSLIEDGGACATAIAETKRDPVYLLFIVDGSGSMAADNKWVSQVAALDAIFDDMLAQQDKDLGVGMILFSDANDPTGGSGPYPSSKDVFVNYVDQAQHDLLRQRIDLSDNSGGTPTFAALSGGYKLLENLVVAAPLPPNGRKVAILMTDGVPNGGATEQDQCTSAATSELAKAGPEGPITTFAIGVGKFPGDTFSYDPKFMGKLAQAGGAAPAGCNPDETVNTNNLCHFQITPNGKPVNQIKQEFIDAINKIRGQVQSCEFTLEQPDGGGTVDPEKVNVIYTDGNGVSHIIVQDENSGWTYDDPAMPTKVMLNGSACTQMKGDPKAKVSVQLGCATKTK